MIRTTIRIYDVHHFHSEDINNLRIFQHTVGTPAQPTGYDSDVSFISVVLGMPGIKNSDAPGLWGSRKENPDPHRLTFWKVGVQ